MAILSKIDALNGVTIAYAVGLTNSLLALLLSFGFHISDDQRIAVVGFINATLVFTAHIAHAQAKSQAKRETALEQAEPSRTTGEA